MYNIVCMENNNELEYFLLIPGNHTAVLNNNEYILILINGEIRRPVLLNYPHHKFEKYLKYFKKVNWN